MILVLDNEIRPDYRYLAPEIARLLPVETEYRVFVDDPTLPEPSEYGGIVLSGSTASVYDDEHASWVEPQSRLVRRCIDGVVPLLGICFGHQLVHAALGGAVEADRRRATFVTMTHEGVGVLRNVGSTVPVLHADLVVEPGEGLETVARTDYDDHFCSRHVEAPLWTVQFHPEFTERVRDRPSDWSEGDGSFEECTATAVLDDFAARCERR